MLSKSKRFRETQAGNPPKSSAMVDSSEPKRSLKLSLFVGLAKSFASEPNNTRSPRCFDDDDGAVGLGIVAAMSRAVGDAGPARPALSRSDPIPIVPGRPMTKPRVPAAREEEDMVLSESYTCVISLVRGNPVRKRVYFDDGSDGVDGNYLRSSGVFYESLLPPPAAAAADDLSCCCCCCFLCQKELLHIGASWAGCFHVQQNGLPL